MTEYNFLYFFCRSFAGERNIYCQFLNTYVLGHQVDKAKKLLDL